MESSDKFISICIPTYNRSGYIQEAIDSVLAQLEPDSEILVVDDGSTDDTVKVIKKFSEQEISYLSKEHTGPSDTRNRCISEARGDFILWLDSDDLIAPGLISRFRELVKQYPDVDIFYGDMRIFGDAGALTGKVIACRDYYERNKLLLSRMVYSNRIFQTGTFIRKALYQRAGGYDTNYNCHEDYEFYTRAAASAKFKHIGMISAYWRWHDANLSRSGNSTERSKLGASILNKMIRQYPLSLLFPQLNWNNPRRAAFVANCELAKIFLRWKDPQSSERYFEKGLQALCPDQSLPGHTKARLEVVRDNFSRMFKATDKKYFQEMDDILSGLIRQASTGGSDF
jgi:O-antigen biosynthesis protein